MTKQPLIELLRDYAESSLCELSVVTIRQYRYSIRRFSEFLGRAATMNDLTEDLFAEFKLWRRRQKVSASTVETDLQHLVALQRWSVNQVPDKGPQSGRLRRSPELLLKSYCEKYIRARSLSPEYARGLRVVVGKFCRWNKTDLHVGYLTPDLVNKWLTWLSETTELTSWSIYRHRQCLLCIWNDAYLAGDNDNPPLRLKKVKRHHATPKAFTHPQILALLDAAARIRRFHSDGNLASIFWQAAIHVGYCTGLRRGDILTLAWSSIAADGAATVTQSKTGYPVRVQFSPPAMEFLRKLERKNDLVFPWPYTPTRFSRVFNTIAVAAGLPHGRFKHLRRSAGSYADSVRAGDGRRLLGHRSEQVFGTYYEDPSITRADAVVPPPIVTPEIKPK